MAGERVLSVSVVRRHFQPSLASFRRFNPSGAEAITSDGLTRRNYRDVEGRSNDNYKGWARRQFRPLSRGRFHKTGRAARNYKRGSKSPKFVCFSSYVLCLPGQPLRSVSRKLRNKQRNGRWKIEIGQRNGLRSYTKGWISMNETWVE